MLSYLTSLILFLVPSVGAASTLPPPPPPILVVAPQPAPVEIHTLTLQEKADMVAQSFGISTTTFASLIKNESGWDPNADNGYDRGLVQISRIQHPDVTDAQAFDVDFSLNWAAQEIKSGRISGWTVCNCWLYTKMLYGPTMPLTKDLKPNSPMRVGAIAIYNYNGLLHYGYVTEGQNDPVYGHWERGSNKKPCEPYTSFVTEDNKYLVGYYFAPASP